MAEIDSRCCGSGTCIINTEGECWCGQIWDGTKMSQPFYINEAGLRVDAVTGQLISAPSASGQCLPP